MDKNVEIRANERGFTVELVGSLTGVFNPRYFGAVKPQFFLSVVMR